MKIIAELKKHKLLGRGGAAFPAALKWELVVQAKAEKKYIICNGAEGDPGVFKDGFILENYPQEVIAGIITALETIDNSSAYLYLRKDYYQKQKNKLKKLIKGYPIEIVKKTGGYLAGEETAVCESIEGKRPEPRIKPPFPGESGLWGCPTLINNVETFYYVAQIVQGKYEKKRFYSISGAVKNKGVYELPLSWSIERILTETKNLPQGKFFLQVGGKAMGEILLSNELKRQVKGSGAIVVYDSQTNAMALLKEMIDFFLVANCDKCTPCREGIYRIGQMVKKGKIDKKALADIFFVLENTSFCALGRGSVLPLKSLINKLL